MTVLHALMRHLSWILFAIIFMPFLIAYFASGLFAVHSPYSIFPILGLLAWSLLSTQYFMGAIRHNTTQSIVNTRFTRISGVMIVIALVLHPLLPIVQLYIDTGLAPPASLAAFVGDSRMYLIWIAVTSLIFFLLFDLLRPYRKSLIKRGIWRFISLTQIFAMLLIFIHALLLGSLFTGAWTSAWWIFLNAALIPCYVLHIQRDFRRAT